MEIMPLAVSDSAYQLSSAAASVAWPLARAHLITAVLFRQLDAAPRDNIPARRDSSLGERARNEMYRASVCSMAAARGPRKWRPPANEEHRSGDDESAFSCVNEEGCDVK